ncbi:hypothetical protein LSUE1_G001712 [Lachnellula suecica]|uniref:Uncharacterized protein n=1 Tax=Lachnellula suecica TaxID=602035 RepID=A0A8T9C392_9HELO|nr:hypothetical protein LSUE1_G001712 [Lachnellula suecica]
MAYQMDSPLSITASIAGILTFVVAIIAASYARISYLRNADSEYFQVKTSLSWYKTESTWMQDLVSNSSSNASSTSLDKNGTGEEINGRKKGMEHEMYTFVMEQLGKLEERLLELLTEVEVAASRQGEGGGKGGWTIVPRGLKGRTDVAMSWLPVRAKALELVRQRDALGSRVLFAQMSMISSRVRDQESRARKREERDRERMERLEKMADAQHEKLDRLENLVYRIMHRSRVNFDGNSESPDCEDRKSTQQATVVPESDESAELESPLPPTERKPSVAATFYPIPSK